MFWAIEIYLLMLMQIYKCASTAKVQMCIAFNSFSLIFITVVVYLVLIIRALSGQFHCQMHPACLFSPAFRIFEFDCQLLWYLLIVPSLFTWYFGLFILCLPCILNSSSCYQYLYLFTVFSTYVVSKLLLLASDGVWLLIVVQF